MNTDLILSAIHDDYFSPSTTDLDHWYLLQGLGAHLDRQVENDHWMNLPAWKLRQFDKIFQLVPKPPSPSELGLLSILCQKLLSLRKVLVSCLRIFLQILHNFGSAYEFPNCFRHPCTTMPWTIWPALAVLWGVCWMFYPGYSGRFLESAFNEGKYMDSRVRSDARILTLTQMPFS